MYSHFQLYGSQPAIFCNILDPSTMKETVEAKPFAVVSRQAILPVDAIADTLHVSAQVTVDGAEQEKLLEQDIDYSVFYDRDDTDTYVCIVELLPDGAAYDAVSLSISYTAVTADTVTVADVVDGVAQVDAAMTVVGTVPDLICAQIGRASCRERV